MKVPGREDPNADIETGKQAGMYNLCNVSLIIMITHKGRFSVNGRRIVQATPESIKGSAIGKPVQIHKQSRREQSMGGVKKGQAQFKQGNQSKQVLKENADKKLLKHCGKMHNKQTKKQTEKMAGLNTEEIGQNVHQVCVIGEAESGGKTGQTEKERRVR